MSRRLQSVALAGILLVTPVMAGCSVQDIVSHASGGNVDIGGTSVPDDFPTEVPLYDGEVLSGVGLGNPTDGKVWNIGIRVPDATVLDDIQRQLTEAGFDAQFQGSPTADGGTLVSTGAGYGVAVVVVPDADGFVANYSVTATPQ